MKPWEWRRGKRLAGNDNAPGQCRIKGNINRKGERIYHAPSGQWYDRTRIDPANWHPIWHIAMPVAGAVHRIRLGLSPRLAG